MDNFYMDIAKRTAQLSYCNRRKVGAVLVSSDGRNIIAYGYNGTISGFPNVCELPDGTTDNDHVLHAETNAIMKAARSGYSTDKTTLYVTVSPCINCAKLIIQSGIKRVVYNEYYHNTDGLSILDKSGIETIKHT